MKFIIVEAIEAITFYGYPFLMIMALTSAGYPGIPTKELRVLNLRRSITLNLCFYDLQEWFYWFA